MARRAAGTADPAGRPGGGGERSCEPVTPRPRACSRWAGRRGRRKRGRRCSSLCWGEKLGRWQPLREVKSGRIESAAALARRAGSGFSPTRRGPSCTRERTVRQPRPRRPAEGGGKATGALAAGRRRGGGCGSLRSTAAAPPPRRQGPRRWAGPPLRERVEPPGGKHVAILDPNRLVEPRYLAYTATPSAGEIVFGIITTESDTASMKGLDGREQTLSRRPQVPRRLSTAPDARRLRGRSTGSRPGGPHCLS